MKSSFARSLSALRRAGLPVPKEFTIHHGDAYTYEFPKGTRWDCAYHDIWTDITTDNLKGMGKLHRKYGTRVGWQDSWKKDMLVSRRRQEKKQEKLYSFYR